MKKATATAPTRRLSADDSTTIWLPLSALSVDPVLQRPLDEARAERLSTVFDLALLGVIEVSARDNGAYHVLDGQHRVAALRLLGFHNELIECKVHNNLDDAAEAARFVGLNTFTKPRAFDRFKVRIKAGDPAAVGVDVILMEFGWKLLAGNIDGCFTAVVAAERVYTGYGTTDKERGPKNLADTLGTLTEAWGHDPSAATGHLVSGLGLFFARHGELVDKPSLVKRLAQFAGGPDNYTGKARGMRDYRGGTLARCVAELTTDLYNKRRSTGQLEAWRS
jgi:hypothetical protein